MDVLRPCLLAGDRGHLADQTLRVVGGPGLDLDGDVAEDVASPGLRGLGDEKGAAGCQTGEEGHDRHDYDKRATRDRVLRDDRHAPVDRRLERVRESVVGLRASFISADALEDRDPAGRRRPDAGQRRTAP